MTSVGSCGDIGGQSKGDKSVSLDGLASTRLGEDGYTYVWQTQLILDPRPWCWRARMTGFIIASALEMQELPFDASCFAQPPTIPNPGEHIFLAAAKVKGFGVMSGTHSRRSFFAETHETENFLVMR